MRRPRSVSGPLNQPASPAPGAALIPILSPVAALIEDSGTGLRLNVTGPSRSLNAMAGRTTKQCVTGLLRNIGVPRTVPPSLLGVGASRLAGDRLFLGAVAALACSRERAARRYRITHPTGAFDGEPLRPVRPQE